MGLLQNWVYEYDDAIDFFEINVANLTSEKGQRKLNIVVAK